MGRIWPMIVNGLVVAFALFFTYIGISFLLMPLLGASQLIEGGPSADKAVVGSIFLLAAAPMFYYVFAPSAKGLPPPPKKSRDERKSPPEGL